MNDIMVGIVAWAILLGSTVWLYLFVKMIVRREWNESARVVTLKDDANIESIEYRHEVMASDE